MLDMKFKVSIMGIIIFMLPMLINIVYCIFPPRNVMENVEKENQVLEFIEQGSRILFAVAICILVSSQKTNYKSLWFILVIIFLVLYYIVWLRYFAEGRYVELLGKSFLFIPMPLALFPVFYYLCAALWLHNYIAFGIMVVFGIVHNIISFNSLHG